MPKRFTDSDKWRDAWFCRLSPIDKLAWLYLCDVCDAAGVFEIVPQNDLAALGERPDWDAFILKGEGRVVRLSADKLWLVRFIDFQYPTGLQSSNKAHDPVRRSIAKNGLKDLPEAPLWGALGKERDTETEPEKDKGNAGARGAPDVPMEVPEPLRGVFADWLAYKRERGESYKPTGLKQLVGRVANLHAEHGTQVVGDAIAKAMANGWKGFDHGIGKSSGRGSPSPPKSRGEIATERFLAAYGASHGDSGRDQLRGEHPLRLEGPAAQRGDPGGVGRNVG